MHIKGTLHCGPGVTHPEALEGRVAQQIEHLRKTVGGVESWEAWIDKPSESGFAGRLYEVTLQVSAGTDKPFRGHQKHPNIDIAIRNASRDVERGIKKLRGSAPPRAVASA